MVDARMRPRFELVVSTSAEETVEQIREGLDRSDRPYEGHFYPKHVEIRIAESERSFWSPELILQVEDDNEGAILRGRFGPRQNLWTLFVAMYSALAFGTLVGLILGSSQATLSQPAWGLWLVPICLVLASSVYGSALIGRSLGGEQIVELRTLVERAVGVEEEPAYVPAVESLVVEATS